MSYSEIENFDKELIEDSKYTFNVNNIKQEFKEEIHKGNSFVNELVENNQNIGKISLAYLHLYGIGAKEDMQRSFLLYNETAKNNYG
ncbi:13097_t:CDS:2, partial [Dentiscutata erythropus]